MNKHIIRLAAFILLLFVPFATPAQNAHKTLQAVVDKINNAPSVTTDFTMTTPDGTLKGNILASGRCFIITTEDNVFDTRFDGTTQWTWNQASGEVSMTTPTPDEILETNPIEIIKTAPGLYNSKMAGSSPGTQTLQLTPRNPRSTDIKEAQIKIARSTNIPLDLKVILKDGQTISFTFSNFTTGSKIEPKQFRYNPALHPGAQIIDLR